MPQDFPLNDRFIRFDSELAFASIPDSISLSGGSRIKVTLDCFVDALPAAAPVSLAGKTATADWEFTMAATGVVSFTTRRTGGNATAIASTSQALVAGRRVVLEGVDDGVTVKLYVNGVVGGTSPASGAGRIVADAVATLIGAGNSRLGLYAFQWMRDEIVVCRLYVREVTGAILYDTSFYENNAAVSGTEDTNFMYGTCTSFEPVYPGSSLL
jgi:hypothetical protein